jgi:hypothetical protein
MLGAALLRESPSQMAVLMPAKIQMISRIFMPLQREDFPFPVLIAEMMTFRVQYVTTMKSRY